MGNDYHTPNTSVIDMMTEEAITDLILGLTQETEAGATQDTPVQTDMPAGTETLDEGMPNNIRAQSRSPHRHRSGSNRPPTSYPRNSSRSRSSSHSSETSPRCSVTIKDNYKDYGDQDYNTTDDYYDEDLN